MKVGDWNPSSVVKKAPRLYCQKTQRGVSGWWYWEWPQPREKLWGVDPPLPSSWRLDTFHHEPGWFWTPSWVAQNGPGPYCQKVWLALEEKQVSYRILKVNMPPGSLTAQLVPSVQ